MKNPSVFHRIPIAAYFLSSLFLLLCLLAQPAKATFPSGLTLTGTPIGTGTGSQSYDTGTDSFTVVGAGEGFRTQHYYSPDNSYFAYTSWAGGDVEIVARLVSISGPVTSSAGLAIRQSNASTEVNKAATFFFPNYWGNGSYLAYEGHGPLVNGLDYYVSGGLAHKAPLNPPYWLKFVRLGQNYGAYWSLDGRDWNLIGNGCGGALLGTGTFNVGLYVANFNYGWTSPATAVFDNLYIGAPRLKYKTSWVGNTSCGQADGYASNRVYALWVKPDDGTCYANSDWDELGQSIKAYKDGKVAFAMLATDGVTAINNSGLCEGTVTGNANNLFLATNNPSPRVYRTGFTWNVDGSVAVSFTTPLGKVGGMAASATRLFVSDTSNGTVHIVDLTRPTPTEIGAIAAGVIAHPGPIAYDGTNFWITDCGSPFPLTNYVSTQSGYTPAIKCFDAAGLYQNRQITGITNPTALAKHPTLDRLYICENGPNHNIRYYTGLLGTPTYAGAFGLTGGLWTNTGNPGLINEPGNGDYRRFYGPTGVGFDNTGNIYVACNGTNAGGTDLRKFDSAGNLVWKQFGLEFVNCGDFDSGKDGQEIYTPEERFTMNYANTAPGSEWSYTAFTRNPFVLNDVRNPNQQGACGVQLRRVPANGNLFMYTNRQGNAHPCAFYYFNNQGSSNGGGTAKPYGWIVNDYSTNNLKLWIDSDGDGQVTAGEEVSIPGFVGPYDSYDVDSQGDIWVVQAGGVNWWSGMTQLKCSGTQTIGSPAVTIPAYSAANYQKFLCPEPIRALRGLKYDRANDVMYCMGQKADGQWVLARYDNWLASSAGTPDDHAARYVIPLPDSAADVTLLAYPQSPNYMGMAFAGDKVFIADLWGPIQVYDAALGNRILTLNPGPEVSATAGWEDMKMGVNAFKRSNGEYLVLEEDAGCSARILLYRWTPTADTTVPGAVTLTAAPQGRAIALTWTGPSGISTSYNIYRGTTSGSLTLYQSSVKSAAYLDLNVTPGTTYYYTVAAVSTVGTGAQSNEVNAAPLNSQVEFVKYDLTTKGTWKTVYGNEGYKIAGQTASLPGYVTTLAQPANTGVLYFSTDPTTDPRALQMVSGSNRTSAFYTITSGTDTTQSWNLAFNDSTTWHQVSVYLWNTGAVSYENIELLDQSTGTVLDSRKPMDYSGGKWLVWNVRGSVTIRLSRGWGNSTPAGIFFDPVQTPAPTLGWWKLDDTGSSNTMATDSSGAGNYGTKAGGTWTTTGKIGGCVTYGGTNATSLLSLPFNSTGSSTLTYTTWFKTSASGVIFGMWNPGPTAFAPVLYVGTDNKLHGAFYTGVIQNMKSTASVNDNQWHHAALTCDGVMQMLYLDGEVVGMLVAPVSQLSSAWYYFIGGQGYVTGWPNTTGTQMYFTGLVDDIRLYNRVLPSSEIWKLSR